MMTRWRQGDGDFTEFAERHRAERETKPEGCSHCGHETVELTNYSRNYGGNVGAHWLCKLCEVTHSASRLGAGGDSDDTVIDVARMLHVFMDRLSVDHG
jgi:transposase-like protein